MKRNQVTEKIWNEAIRQFFYTPHLPGDTLLIRKNFILHDFALSIYYHYLVETNKGIERIVIKCPPTHRGYKFTYQFRLAPILEV
jgi:hypothetical protein